MSINLKTVMAGLANTTSDLIGTSLSQIGTAPNNLPSVFLARDKVPKPSYPYAVVNFITMERESGQSFTDTYQNNDSEVVHNTNYVIVLTVAIYGDIDTDTTLISQQLSDLLLTDSGMDSIATNVSGMLRDVSDISFFSQRKNDLYEEVSKITVDIAITSTLTDTNVGTINNINIDDSGYYQEIDDEDSILDISVTVP